MARDVYRVSIRGAGQRAAHFTRAARLIQDDVVREIRLLGRETATIFQQAAPADTGDLVRSIRAVPFFGRASRPRVSIRVERLRGHGGDESDYLTATRRGHKARRIYPTRSFALKVHTEGHRNPHIFLFCRSVQGTRVPGKSLKADWVVTADKRSERVRAASQARLARKVERRVLG